MEEKSKNNVTTTTDMEKLIEKDKEIKFGKNGMKELKLRSLKYRIPSDMTFEEWVQFRKSMGLHY